MKAAVLRKLGTDPRCEEFASPLPKKDELLLRVRAASLKNIDKLRASGKHYASHTDLPTVVGLDGVGILENGMRVYAQGLSGMIAEQALIAKGRFTPIPASLDDATAAALPNAVIGSALALRFRAGMKRGQTVLINGATGVTGQIALQIARHYGAKTIIATGRNPGSLDRLKTLGADVVMSLRQEDAAIVDQLRELHSIYPIDIVVDYLWGHPVELILKALQGGGISTIAHGVRLVTVGSMAGETINLASGSLRSSAIEILGSGLGSFSLGELKAFGAEILTEMFELAAAGKLVMPVMKTNLADIETTWNLSAPAGERIVVMMADSY